MSFTDYVKKGIEIAKLNGKVAEHVAKDKNATGMGVLILVLAGVAAAIGRLNPVGIIAIPIANIVGWFIMIGVFHLIALLFGGKATFSELYRPLTVSSVIYWVSVIPFIGPVLSSIASLWEIVVSVVVIRDVHKLSTGKAVAVVVIPIVVVAVIALVMLTLFAATFGLGMTGYWGSMMGGRYW